MTGPILAARNIVVRYGGVAALAGVDCDLAAGEVHALLGENGAGKSTLMKVLAGAVRPAAGALTIDGAAVTFHSPRDAHAAGVRMVHQELRLVPALSAAANIVLGREPRALGFRIDRRAARATAAEALARLGPAGAAINVDTPVAALSLAQRQLVEIAKALGAARILILDEPTAVLSPRECNALFETIARLTAAGVSVLYTTHRLEEVERLAHRVTILRDGARVAHGPAGGFTRQAIIADMVGRETTLAPARRPAPANAPPVLVVEHLAAPGVDDASLVVRVGEIVGLVGLVGAGRTELARAIVGAAPIRRGTVTLRGAQYRPRSPRDAVERGIGYIPEDRAGEALIPTGSLRANLTLPSLGALSRLGVTDGRAERRLTREWVDRLAMRTASVDAPVMSLSGGTQQKVVLARWLARRPHVLIADEPTRGVDVGARAEIYRALRAAAGEGAGVLVVTSDLEEALALCDRLVVMREGRVVGALSGADCTAARVGTLMMPA